MISLFRKLREGEAKEGKTLRYLKYALGEIFLVVIGILIAVQINNANEQRKIKASQTAYIQALLNDLQKDLYQITEYNTEMIEDMSAQEKLIVRLRSDKTNIDTVIKIARYEFNPYYNPGKGLNTNTYESLKNTGYLELLDDWLQEGLLQLNNTHLESMTVIEYALEHHRDIFTDYDKDFPIGNNEEERMLNQKMLDDFWKSIPKEEIAKRFMGLFESKYLMQQFVVSRRQAIANETNDLIVKIHDAYPELNQ